jgi:PAS domain S-box-containing protein
MDGEAGRTRLIEVEEAASLLRLPVVGVEALIEGDYLVADPEGRVGLGDVKALQARLVAETGFDVEWLDRSFLDPTSPVADPQALLDALEGRSDDMARRALDVFRAAVPSSATWDLVEQHRFVSQARQRFEAILAIAAHGDDEELVADLAGVGASAAWAGAGLPELLVMLRISRDLVVQTAVDVAEAEGRHWGLALSLLLTRVLPATDRLTDAIAAGYWDAVVAEAVEERARHESVVEQASDGIYELDPHGRIEYANPALALLLGRQLDELEGEPATRVFVPADPATRFAGVEPGPGPWRFRMAVRRPDGVRREIDVLAMERRRGDEVAGYFGIVHDVTAEKEAEARRKEFVDLVTGEARQPLSTIAGLAAMLESHAGELPTDRLQRIGTSVRQQAERLSRLADDLSDVSRIEASNLLLSPRTVQLHEVVDAALFAVRGSDAVDLDVPEGLRVRVDPRRLEQVVANLVENGLVHGAPPVRLWARATEDEVELVVLDAGPGVDRELEPRLFEQLPSRDQVGLWLSRRLVEAMGGRLWHERQPDGAPAFHLSLPTPPRSRRAA